MRITFPSARAEGALGTAYRITGNRLRAMIIHDARRNAGHEDVIAFLRSNLLLLLDRLAVEARQENDEWAASDIIEIGKAVTAMRMNRVRTIDTVFAHIGPDNPRRQLQMENRPSLDDERGDTPESIERQLAKIRKRHPKRALVLSDN